MFVTKSLTTGGVILVFLDFNRVRFGTLFIDLESVTGEVRPKQMTVGATASQTLLENQDFAERHW